MALSPATVILSSPIKLTEESDTKTRSSSAAGFFQTAFRVRTLRRANKTAVESEEEAVGY